MRDSFFKEHENPLLANGEPWLVNSPSFRGDRGDLEAFVRLIRTPIRHASRSEALHEWKAYNRVPTYNSRGIAVKARPRFRRVDLRGADMRNLCIGYVDLREARLDGVDLRGACMKGAWLDGASLEGAQLDDGYFPFASFANAKLTRTSARRANFREAKLIGADLSNSNLTGALLADTQHRNWILRDVVCDYVYWSNSESAAYMPGEFERLFSEEAMVTLESPGISDQELSTLPMLVRALKMHHGAVVRLHSIQDEKGKFLVRLKIEDNAGYTANVLRSVLEGFRSTIAQNINIENLIVKNEIETIQLFKTGGTTLITQNYYGAIGTNVNIENLNGKLAIDGNEILTRQSDARDLAHQLGSIRSAIIALGGVASEIKDDALARIDSAKQETASERPRGNTIRADLDDAAAVLQSAGATAAKALSLAKVLAEIGKWAAGVFLT